VRRSQPAVAAASDTERAASRCASPPARTSTSERIVLVESVPIEGSGDQRAALREAEKVRTRLLAKADSLGSHDLSLLAAITRRSDSTSKNGEE